MIDVRLGNGFDVHAFTEGSEVTLCGIKIPFSKKLLGHLKEISVVDFDHKDVVRHPLVSKIVKAYSDQSSDG